MSSRKTEFDDVPVPSLPLDAPTKSTHLPGVSDVHPAYGYSMTHYPILATLSPIHALRARWRTRRASFFELSLS